MSNIEFSLNNLDNITEPIELKLLNKEQVYELQLALEFLGYKVGNKDGIIGNKTISAFADFKKNTFQKDPHIIGKGSVDIILKLVDKDTDTIEKEDLHPRQPSLTNPLITESKSISNVNWNDFDSAISKYFTVGEITRFDRQRIPNSTAVKSNILKLCLELDKVREAWGKPIGVTSAYRPPHVNRRVGGAKFSQHLNGGAADIYPIGGNIYEFQKWLDQRWYGALGYGAPKNFVHIDIRNGKGFKSGGSKGPRWNY